MDGMIDELKDILVYVYNICMNERIDWQIDKWIVMTSC